jgi:hypothetical protein
MILVLATKFDAAEIRLTGSNSLSDEDDLPF